MATRCATWDVSYSLLLSSPVGGANDRKGKKKQRKKKPRTRFFASSCSPLIYLRATRGAPLGQAL